MEDIYDELDEILSKDNHDQFVSDYREQQETADRLIEAAADAADKKQAEAMKGLSNLFIRAVNYKHAIRRKHVDISKQMLEKDFSAADDLAEASPEIESSAMLLIARAWLRSKLTYLQVSGPLWAKIGRLIELQIPLESLERSLDKSASFAEVSLSVTHEEREDNEDADADADADADGGAGALAALRSLATSIYRYIGTYGNGLSLDLELRTQAELLRELKDANNHRGTRAEDDDEDNDDDVPEKILSEFDDVIDDAFDYDRLRSRPLNSVLSQSLLSRSDTNNNDNNTKSLHGLVPLGSREVVEQWLSEYLDADLLSQIEANEVDAQDEKETSGEETLVDLRHISESGRLFLRAMGLPCEEAGCDGDDAEEL